MSDLPQDVSDQIEELSEEGNVALEDEELPEKAIRLWSEALALLPQPQNAWEPYHWLHGSIGEAQWQRRDYQTALDHFVIATGRVKACPTRFSGCELGNACANFGETRTAGAVAQGLHDGG